MTSLRELAPLDLPNLRTRRYLGDDLALPLAVFSPDDQRRIRDLYSYLQRLFATVSQGEPSERLTAALDLLAGVSIDELVEEIRLFGPSSYAAAPSPLLAKTIHDVRGGGLTPLLGQLQFLAISRQSSDVEPLYFLARDHLKIMRNALLGLDDARRNEDLLPKTHDTQMIMEKHDCAVLQSHGRAVRLEVECLQHVPISECCVEFGALDRILYNLLNNACRHTATDTLRLVLFPVPDEHPENLRLILSNTVTPADAAYLRGLDLTTLFQHGVSTTGSGAGLSVVSQFVANAFGLPSPEAAVAARYLGAQLVADEFIIWFHWPILAEY